MQYPILNVKTLPPLYKHCKVVKAVSLRFDNTDAFYALGDEIKKKAYLEYIENEILKVVDNHFIGWRGQIIVSKDKKFIIFKDNFDLRQFERTITNLFKEANDYVDGQIDFYYSVLNAILFLEGGNPSLFAITKLGDDIFDSKEYPNSFKKVEMKNVKGLAKFLTSYEDFTKAYMNQADYYCI